MIDMEATWTRVPSAKISIRLRMTTHESIQQSKRLTSTYQEKDKKVEISQRNVHDRGRVATIRAWKFWIEIGNYCILVRACKDLLEHKERDRWIVDKCVNYMNGTKYRALWRTKQCLELESQQRYFIIKKTRYLGTEGVVTSVAP